MTQLLQSIKTSFSLITESGMAQFLADDAHDHRKGPSLDNALQTLRHAISDYLPGIDTLLGYLIHHLFGIDDKVTKVANKFFEDYTNHILNLNTPLTGRITPNFK